MYRLERISNEHQNTVLQHCTYYVGDMICRILPDLIRNTTLTKYTMHRNKPNITYLLNNIHISFQTIIKSIEVNTVAGYNIMVCD